MKITNDTNSYGFLARLFHWITFVILLFQLPLGIYLDNLEFSEFKLSIENVHIIIGMTIFYITLLRLIWKSINTKPIDNISMSKIQIIASQVVHGLFYMTLLVITISGISKLLMSGEEVNFIIMKVSIDYYNFDLADKFYAIHALSAYFLLILFSIHLSAVIYHHAFQKDKILRKML